MELLRKIRSDPTSSFRIRKLAIRFRLVVAIHFAVLLWSATPQQAAADNAPLGEKNRLQPFSSSVYSPETSTCDYPQERICRFYDIITVAARRHQVDLPLILATIHAESRYNPKAVSRSGAKGLMQLMPQTAASLGVVDSFDPEQNVDAGVRYLKWLMKKLDGDRDLALAAYHAGLSNVYRHNGVPPFPATRAYIRTVLSWYKTYGSPSDPRPDEKDDPTLK